MPTNTIQVDTEYVPVMMTIQEVADKTGINYGTIYRWAKRGEIAHVKAGSKYLINWQKFLAFLNMEDE